MSEISTRYSVPRLEHKHARLGCLRVYALFEGNNPYVRWQFADILLNASSTSEHPLKQDVGE